MKNEITDVSLQQQVDELSKEMSPERDLWPGIEKAMAKQSQSNAKRPFYPVAWAATVVVAVLVSWLSFSPQPGTSTSNVDIAQVMQQDFNEQKQLMLVNLGQPDLKQLSPDMQKQFDELKKAQQAISKALENDPTSVELLNLLRWTQKQELDLLKQIYSPKWQTI